MRFVLSALALLIVLTGTTRAQEFGDAFVFEFVFENLESPPSDIVARIEEAAAARGLEVLGRLDAGVQEDCSYEARVVSLFDAEYAGILVALNPDTAPFAVVDRVVVFTDEKGAHVAYVNPAGINRTVLLSDTGVTEVSMTHREALRDLLSSAVGEETSDRGYGPERDRGYIGRTMGVMAGGPFDEKIQVLATAEGADSTEIVDRLRQALAEPGPRWGLRVAYEATLPAGLGTVLGVTGKAMEAQSFDIVGAGSDKSRKKLECPGLAHAAAYPIELVVARTDSGVEVRLVDAMYRMKMYFADAGQWAFMKNMGMPGSIADEIRSAVHTVIPPP